MRAEMKHPLLRIISAMLCEQCYESSTGKIYLNMSPSLSHQNLIATFTE
jgi:hypothetical protein